MTTKAPHFQSVNALTGDVAESSPVLGILATAEHIHTGLAERDDLERENDRLARDNDMLRAQAESLLTRVDELTDELDELRLSREQLWGQCAEVTVLRAEVERLRGLRDTVQTGWRS